MENNINTEDLIQHIQTKIQQAVDNDWDDYKAELESILNHEDFPDNLQVWPLSPLELEAQEKKKTSG